MNISKKAVGNIISFPKEMTFDNAIDIPEEIIIRFAYKNKINITEAKNLFMELQLFLDIASYQQSTPSKLIDEAWHEFILHTKQYATFCKTKYGRFIHHVPTPLLSCNSQPPDPCSSGVTDCSSDCSSDY